jgi:hypothetical protein
MQYGRRRALLYTAEAISQYDVHIATDSTSRTFFTPSNQPLRAAQPEPSSLSNPNLPPRNPNPEPLLAAQSEPCRAIRTFLTEQPEPYLAARPESRTFPRLSRSVTVVTAATAVASVVAARRDCIPPLGLEFLREQPTACTSGHWTDGKISL